ncbi:hypothetical protein ESCOCP322M2_23960 [Escherichia coli]
MHEEDEILIPVLFKQIEYRPRHHHRFPCTGCHVKQQMTVMQQRLFTFTLRVMQVTQCTVLIRTQGILQIRLNVVRRLVVIVEQPRFIKLLQLVKQQLLAAG